MKEMLLCSEEKTRELGRRLAGLLPVPSFVALYGDLGAGKTALVRGIGEALGTEEVTSPTFTILHEYKTVPPLYHLDAYRLSDGSELLDIGFEDYLDRRGIVVLEWADQVEDVLPEDRLNLTLAGSGSEARRAVLDPHGAKYEKVVENL